ncbi:HEPN domain-containing protein [Solitalea koreensis]|uniref:Sulfite reductase (Ferredoxin) n=1 Tax=Solitalea koreensis TaxID=543615 RepID=A0A521D8G1_9SPHI|nr:HEPN domain-containing protein [Solitalea koreensis]SMO67983.1 sulfite reductase (ferredoxin) [Solitalea koreensis]
MQSFRTELENPIVEHDILELERKIRLYREGKIDEEKFRSLRLARGVYGQRQTGVQMVRIKLPYGKITKQQLERICRVSEEYSRGNLHITTRQDIQIHYVSLDRTPELWTELEHDDITLREACGNTVRNVTASSFAGIDPKEPFDVSPYAQAFFEYFLRNPVCQEMGRKVKIAFSSSEDDTAYTFMHDLGFLPKIRNENGEEVRGFKVMLGGGLGSQPYLAEAVSEFMHEDDVIPFSEAVLRIFDRYGERSKRHKARMKYLLQDLGLEGFLKLVEEEKTALKVKTFKIDRNTIAQPLPPEPFVIPDFEIKDHISYENWLNTNVFKQKQEGYFAVGIKVLNGDLRIEKARKLIEIIKDLTADEIRLTNTQGVLLKFVPAANLPYLFYRLNALGLADIGFESTADVTSCPGTDTCNLGISNSTGITREFEKVIYQEYSELVHNNDIKIKISGCINSCGQHAMASIGFHGSSTKVDKLVVPALQVLIGGGILGDGQASVAEKIIKVPSKRGLDVLRYLLDDYQEKQLDGEYFNQYYLRQGKSYFYELLSPLADTSNLTADDFVDWGNTEPYKQAIGVGECAGVTIDLVATLFLESEEKIENAVEAFNKGDFSDSIYYAYTSYINSAKALLVSEGAKTNTQTGIIKDFDIQFVQTAKIHLEISFEELVYQINKSEPTSEFAEYYINQAKLFIRSVINYRQSVLSV